MITYNDEHDSIDPARGVVLAILLSLPFWVLFVAGIATLL
jgi:hypothetical protein